MLLQEHTKALHLSAQLECVPKKAFQMFTAKDSVESWLVRPYGGSHADIEPRVGGKYEVFWDPKDRENDSTIGCKVTAIQPGTFLAFEWKGPKQFKHFMNTADPLTHVVVFFVPVTRKGEQITEVHLIHSGWGSSREWMDAMKYSEAAWNSALQNLAKEVNSPSPG